eukprot:TRINITY_DN4621_c0_g1_i2.p1 TRINITY_DN4621_c0_g1~~TRINITY_DN4621_c0_g1_i2.p1  ORF type:complete len:174 (-),score=34.21 TRINITY_DN4621_c0_g1_i2:324-845(-)
MNSKAWDAHAEDYSKASELVTKLFSYPTWDTISKSLNVENPFVLDIAAGSGAMTSVAAENLKGNGKILATDYSEKMVEIMKRDLGHHPNIEFKVMDGMNLELSDATFDVVVSMFGVMMFPDPLKGLKEMARVAKKRRESSHWYLAKYDPHDSSNELIATESKLWSTQTNIAIL